MSTGAAARNNVHVYGPEDGPVLVFAHGFGTDQSMWVRILPWFTDRYRVVLLDQSAPADPTSPPMIRPPTPRWTPTSMT